MAKLLVTLKQHTPLIHFEQDVEGATLRATEFKPKLDKFLIENIFSNDKEQYKDLLINGQEKAFDYKVKIKIKEGPIKKNIKIKDSKCFKSLYFGYMGDGKEKDLSFYENIEVEFFSFKNKIIEKIKEVLPKFLFFTNFGTRQNKGFGSFFIDKSDPLYPKEDGIINFSKRYKNQFLYLQLNDKLESKKIFNLIDIMYKLMKSGVNFPKQTYYKSFLFKYFLDKGIGNEKKFIKENFFKDSVRVKDDGVNKKYIRGLLGINDSIEFKDKDRIGKILYNSEVVERFKSPITFKVIDNVIFIFAEKEIEEIKGKTFVLSQKNNKNRTKTINIPSEFDLQDFLFKFANYINDEVKENKNNKNIFENQIKELKKYKIEKVGERECLNT